MSCKISNNITRDCMYRVAGVKRLYLANFDVANKYEQDADGVISAITLGTGQKVYQMEFADGTAQWTDDLTAGGNSNKYRTHTLTFIMTEYDTNILKETQALDLGRYTAFVVDNNNKVVCLGRLNGMVASSDNYASGAAEADANGFTIVMAGIEQEVAQLVKDEEIVRALLQPTVTVTD